MKTFFLLLIFLIESANNPIQQQEINNKIPSVKIYVNFEPNSFKIAKSEKQILDTLKIDFIQILSDNDSFCIEIDGNADQNESVKNGLEWLSKKRAEAVYRYLNPKKFNDRYNVIYHGTTLPLLDSKKFPNEAGPNRRVYIKIVTCSD